MENRPMQRQQPRFGGAHGARIPGEKPRDRKAVIKRLWPYMARKKGALAVSALLVALSSSLMLAGPLLIGIAIDRYIIPGDYKGLLGITLLMAMLYILGAAATWLQNYVIIGMAQEAVRNIRLDVFERLQELPLKFFDSRQHGDVMSRLTNDVENISSTLNTSITQIASSVLMLAGTIAMMLYLSPLLTLLTLTIVPLMLYTTETIAKATKERFLEQQRAIGELNGYIEESISGIKAVKVFTREREGLEAFEKGNSRLRDCAIPAQIFSGVIPPLMNLLNNMGFAIVAGAGGYLAVKGTITVGVIASFINYSRQFSRPLNELANQFNTFQTAIAGAERVFEIADEQPETKDAPDAIRLENVKGEVILEGVTFGYEEGQSVLKDISMHVPPGRSVALVGPTGAGKTTIVNLLTRFYDVSEGRILIDGIDIRNISRDSLRSSLGIVLQDTYLFSGTVMDNIRYGRLDATDEEVELAARLSNAHCFIRRLPQRYDTILSEDGSNLSQGQKQLIAIARAVLADPAILILDEATSSVDTRTEMHIQEAMLKLMKNRTSFVIAHRLGTIKNADTILVINGGEIIERGSHEELLRKGGFYHDLYNSQFRRTKPE